MFAFQQLTIFVIAMLMRMFEGLPQAGRIHQESSNPDKVNAIEWDYFMLVTEWPQSSCEYVNATHQHHTCIIPDAVNGWTIHGLWPSVEKGEQPFFCEPWKFDEDKVKDLEGNLELYWPNIFVETTPQSFWKHEYEKHGTCASSVKGFETEHDYFQKALELREKFDIMRVLSESKIVPSTDSSYQFSDIEEALKSGYSAKVCFECSGIKHSKQVLSAGYVCLNKQLEQIDCGYCEHGCKTDEPIFYHSKSSTLYEPTVA
ncbi:ribonuclease Oy [Hydra vulgaris]|uniref:Ribonuclease Oy n=1 Tax=Hydra vulgaris TaxID=6087 RepID=A0ABM4CJ65_HYDVU